MFVSETEFDNPNFERVNFSESPVESINMLKFKPGTAGKNSSTLQRVLKGGEGSDHVS